MRRSPPPTFGRIPAVRLPLHFAQRTHNANYVSGPLGEASITGELVKHGWVLARVFGELHPLNVGERKVRRRLVDSLTL